MPNEPDRHLAGNKGLVAGFSLNVGPLKLLSCLVCFKHGRSIPCEDCTWVCWARACRSWR
jgi:hypothetical protein